MIETSTGLFEIDKGSNKVFVYIVDMNKYMHYVAQLWHYLSAQEKEQAKGYYTTSLTAWYVISHGILRCILSDYVEQSPESIEFICNNYGKPFLKKNDVQFNMSHSHNMACYIVACNCMVGIDIEYYDCTLDITGLSELVLTSSEIKFLATLAPRDKHKVFYNLWAKKESLVKAMGQGLFYHVNTIEAWPLIFGDKVVLIDDDSTFKQELYSYALDVGSDYSSFIAVSSKINEIVYSEIGNQQWRLNKPRVEHFKLALQEKL